MTVFGAIARSLGLQAEQVKGLLDKHQTMYNESHMICQVAKMRDKIYISSAHCLCHRNFPCELWRFIGLFIFVLVCEALRSLAKGLTQEQRSRTGGHTACEKLLGKRQDAKSLPNRIKSSSNALQIIWHVQNSWGRPAEVTVRVVAYLDRNRRPTLTSSHAKLDVDAFATELPR